MAGTDTNPPAGTRDFLPDEVVRRQRAFATIRNVFERHGFAPLDTPAFERLDVLTGKYGDEGDQLIFKILRRGDHEATGEADLALRYDLTVPLARVMARYPHELVMPFKRYHIASVWRADRPGKGRFREFTQCDVDTVGSDSPLADAETVLAVTDVLAALGLHGFEVQLNSRQALRGLVEAYGVPAGLEETALVALDKLDKVGPDGVAAELRDRGVAADVVEAITADLGSYDLEARVRDRLGATARGKAGLAEVDDVLQLVAPHLVGGIRFAPVLARGLSYYTGTIFEVVHPGLGATIAAGGRYDGLVGMFSGQDIAAVGCSLGVERVLLLLDAGADAASTGPPVLVTVMDDSLRGDALALAASIRRAGIDADLFVGSGRLGKQLRYGDRRGAHLAVIRGSDERDAATVAVKDLASGDQVTVPEADLVAHLRSALGAGRPHGAGS